MTDSWASRTLSVLTFFSPKMWSDCLCQHFWKLYYFITTITILIITIITVIGIILIISIPIILSTFRFLIHSRCNGEQNVSPFQCFSGHILKSLRDRLNVCCPTTSHRSASGGASILKGGLTKHINDENLNFIGLYETFGAAVRHCDTYDIINKNWHYGSTFGSNSLVLLCRANKKATLASLVLSDEWLHSAFL